MTNRLCASTFALLLAAACSSGDGRRTYDFGGYDDSADPLANLGFCYEIARSELGPGAVLYLVRGVQLEGHASTAYSLGWRWYFVNPQTHQLTSIDTAARTVETTTSDDLPVEKEYVAEDDPRLAGLVTVEAVWNACVQQQAKALLYVDVYIPLAFPPTNPVYLFVTRDGLAQVGVDAFFYDARTGDYLPQ